MAKLSALSKFVYKAKEKLPTGIDCLDTVLNNGPEQGDLIGIASKQGGGKSTMLLQLTRTYIENYDMNVLYVDVERGVKTEMLEAMGLTKHMESGKLFLSNQINTYSDLQELLEEVLDPEAPVKWGMLIIDSLTQVVPAKMLDIDIESQQMALKARAMTAFLDKYRGRLANANIITWAVVQYRKNLNQTFYGASEYNTAAPMALNHACDVMLHITTSQAKDRALTELRDTPNGTVDTKVGAVHFLWSEKNKHATPFIKVNFPVIYGRGISNVEYLRRLLLDRKLIKKSGGWIKEVAGKAVSIQGDNGLREYIRSNFEDLRTYLFEKGYYSLIGMVNVLDEQAAASALLDKGMEAGTVEDFTTDESDS